MQRDDIRSVTLDPIVDRRALLRLAGPDDEQHDPAGQGETAEREGHK